MTEWNALVLFARSLEFKFQVDHIYTGFAPLRICENNLPWRYVALMGQKLVKTWRNQANALVPLTAKAYFAVD